jgi:hypothetical protein
MALTPEQRKLRARTAALTRSATEDTVAMTAPARAAFEQSFIEQAREGIGPFVDRLKADYPHLPEAMLQPLIDSEVERRAVALRKLYYTRLGQASAKARAQKGRAVKPARSEDPGETRVALTQVDDTATPPRGSEVG